MQNSNLYWHKTLDLGLGLGCFIARTFFYFELTFLIQEFYLFQPKQRLFYNVLQNKIWHVKLAVEIEEMLDKFSSFLIKFTL